MGNRDGGEKKVKIIKVTFLNQLGRPVLYRGGKEKVN